MRFVFAAALLLTLQGCAVPLAVWTGALGACAAACAPVVAFEKDVFDWATGQDQPPAKP